MPDQNPSGDGWMNDVQRALALLIIGLLCLSSLGFVARLIWSAPVDDIGDLTKTMLAALVNMGLIALGFFFGSSKSKETADASQARLVDKLTLPLPPAPVPPPVAPWWGRLTDAEKTVITAAAPGDARVAAFVTASATGAATADDLTYLVGRGLLTQDRATAIQAA